jgi:alpha-galactosidase
MTTDFVRNALRRAYVIRLIAVTFILIGSLIISPPLATAQQTDLSPTPPMGWNSWDGFGRTVRESEVKANAGVMASTLKRFGWQYTVIDIQ